MLNAILSRKHGRSPESLPTGASWGDIFRLTEDFLTASVFERLAYLDGLSLWSILREVARPQAALPARRVVKLTSIEFWPRWDTAEGVVNQDSVEPDVLMRFEVGDPAEPVAVLVESKIRGNRQTAAQWHTEWLTWHAEETRDGRTPPRMVFLAIDGLGAGGPEGTVETLTARVRELPGGVGLPITAAATRWSDLLRTVRRYPLHSESERHIRADIVRAFGFLGFRDISPFEIFAAFASQMGRISSSSLDKFARVGRSVRHSSPPLSSFSRLDGLRPIVDHLDDFPRLERPHAD